jgi:parvulin-like peptidyl-prolyl isomerase
MTSRPRPTTRPTPRRRSRFSLGDEDRQSALILGAFVAVIVLLVVLLLGAWGLSYYEANLRAVANVGGLEIRPDMARDRAALMALRLDREQNRVIEARAADEIDSATAQARITQLQTQREELGFTATENLIDIIYQSQLAAEMNIVVTPDDVAAREDREMAAAERRHVRVVVIRPEVSEGAVSATFTQQREARERAEQARAELEGGRPFEEVAAEYTTVEDLPNDGDFGFISRISALDRALVERLFELDEGQVTQVIRGDDGDYRVGQLVEIRAGGGDVAFRQSVQERLSIDRYRQFMEWEIASERLQQRIMAEALEGTHGQVHLAHIRIDNVSPDDEIGGEDEDQVHYSEILFAPNDDPVEAPELDEDDPAWAEAEADAEGIADELRAIEDTTERLDRFREIARDESDNEGTAAEGGDAGAVTRDIPPSEVADILFDEQHEEETLIGPVRAENGFYLLWFHERQDPPSQRLEQLSEALDQPSIDWDALVEEFSDDAQSRDEGGQIGWWTQPMLNQIQDELGDEVFGLQVGGTTEPVGLGSSTHVFRVVERAERAVDADQARFIRTTHFEDWYSDRKDEAEDDGTIRRTDESPDEDPGADFGEGIDDLGEDFEVPGIDEGETAP